MTAPDGWILTGDTWHRDTPDGPLAAWRHGRAARWRNPGHGLQQANTLEDAKRAAERAYCGAYVGRVVAVIPPAT